MSALDRAPEVVDLAHELGLGSPARPVKAITGLCLARIAVWVEESGGVADIATLEALVARQLQVVFEEVWSDEDFDVITEKYARGKRDPVFAAMRLKFDDTPNPIYGALVRRKSAVPSASDRYVAVIDCRGIKASRRFFTRWHEIAHRLTTHADSGPTDPSFRSQQHPIERLMDEIAGQIAFYPPLFDPVFCAAQNGRTLLRFATVERVRQRGFPEASFQATLCACTRRLPTPVIYVEAALGHKKAVQKGIEDDSPRLLAFRKPDLELRAVRTAANEAAQAERFVIPRNMRVPEGSIIRSLFAGSGERDGTTRENLSTWSDSKGKRLAAREVVVEARRLVDSVLATVQPAEMICAKPNRRTT